MSQYITVKDLMKLYKVSKTTIYNWIEEGLPKYKFGKCTRFTESEVDTWLKVHKGQIVQEELKGGK